MPELILKEEVYRIVGAAMDVWYTLGREFLEPVYQEALQIELGRRDIPFEAQKLLRIEYKGLQLKKEYVADFVCFGQIIVEIKAVSAVADEHRAQLLNYLSATRCNLGLLVNFGHYPKMEYERLITKKLEPADVYL